MATNDNASTPLPVTTSAAGSLSEQDSSVSVPTKPTNSSRWPEPIGSIRAAFKKNRNGPEFRKLVTTQFEQAANPYEIALFLIVSSPDNLQPRVNAMSMAILKDFASWIRMEEREEKFRRMLTMEIQERAFHVATKRHTILLSTAVTAFHLKDVAEAFVEDVRRMANNGQFREAAECAAALGIQRYFGLNEILIPCILQDKLNYVEPYLADSPELQQELVHVLDELCAPQVDITRFLSQYNLLGIRKDKLCYKPLQKLVARLSKLYNIPSGMTPNLAYTRSQGTLRYILHKRYDEKTMHEENWNDLIKQAMESCPEMLEYLLELLCVNYKDNDEAAKWVGFYKVDISRLPRKLQQFIDDKPEALFPENGVDRLENPKHRSVTNGDYLCLPMCPDSVVMVDSEAALMRALEEIEAMEIVGMDTEWSTGFGQSVESVALLQVATTKHVFLIDVLTLKDSVQQDVLKDTMRRLFGHDRPRKLGFAFGGDVKTLAVTLPFCQSELVSLSNTVCVCDLVKHLVQENPDFVDGYSCFRPVQQNNGENGQASANKDTQAKSKGLSASKFTFNLAELCQHFLGKPLDKSEQYSNWSRRPLRWSQIRYAALDAYCLLSMYEILRRRAVELKVDFERAVLRSLVTRNKAMASKRDRKSAELKKLRRAELLEMVKELNLSMEAAGANCQIRRPADIRVVADNMLQGLGRHLRRCGVDCRIAENQEPREAIIAAAKKELRILLTSGAIVSMAASRLPCELICAVPSSLSAKEQLAWFLKKMGIRVTEEDIFSRCMICNCSSFLFIPSPLLRVIYDAIVAPNDPLSEEPFNLNVAFKGIREFLQTVCSSNGTDQSGPGQLNTNSSSEQPPFSVDDEKWVLDFNGFKLDLLIGTILSQTNQQNVRVQIEAIPAESAFEKIKLFYVCCECGKIYWDGSHTGRYVSNLKNIVDLEQLSDSSDKDTEQ